MTFMPEHKETRSIRCSVRFLELFSPEKADDWCSMGSRIRQKRTRTAALPPPRLGCFSAAN